MDVVEKLRNRATNWSEPNGADSILDLEAAEEIVRLRKGIREIGEYPVPEAAAKLLRLMIRLNKELERVMDDKRTMLPDNEVIEMLERIKQH